MRLELLTPLLDHTFKGGITRGRCDQARVRTCARRLEFCSKFNIIHRDIKPENIFIAPSGDYKLGDFGIAKTVEKTRLGMSRRGTVVYMAPEVFKGEAYGSTVDIYSLGLVMYRIPQRRKDAVHAELSPPYKVRRQGKRRT
ncbi:MAG: protein kinase [Anaerovoracaceae bacterium]